MPHQKRYIPFLIQFCLLMNEPYFLMLFPASLQSGDRY